MPKYGFFLTRIFPYKDRIFEYTGIYGSEKTRILAYFTQCRNSEKIYFTYTVAFAKNKIQSHFYDILEYSYNTTVRIIQCLTKLRTMYNCKM